MISECLCALEFRGAVLKVHKTGSIFGREKEPKSRFLDPDTNRITYELPELFEPLLSCLR